MRTITNEHHDSQILDFRSGYETVPFLVTQMGVAPNDPVPKTKMFVLRPDGRWVDFNAYACKGKPEAMDEIVFPTMAEVMKTFSTLSGRPQVMELPLDKEGIKPRLTHHEAGTPPKPAQPWTAESRNGKRGPP